MISRIYVVPKVRDSRERLFLKSWALLGLSGKLSTMKVFDSYIIDSDLPYEDLCRVAGILTNPNLEDSFVNKLNTKLDKFKYVVEVGFLPGVTDNVGNSARETILDFFHLDKNADIKVFSSKVFLIGGHIRQSDVERIAASLHNSLIERSYIVSVDELKRVGSLPLRAPEVVLESRAPIITVPLNVSDEELSKIGREGILDRGIRRGPLALDLVSMKTIQAYFNKLGRDPRDIELEALAQTWSEHCKHTIFAGPLDDIKDGLYKTYIKAATNLIRKNKGQNDFCVSVFSDNSGGIIFDDDYLITHKVETHNSPSALDPFGGAITGIVGVNRDTIGFGLGAKPVANAFGYCFGNPEDERGLYKDIEKKFKMFPAKRIMEGVIRGVNVGGNCSGIPTVSGFVRFDDRFRGKPLVFVGTLGIIPRQINDKFAHEKKAEVGDFIVVVGGRVGADGIHGATFSSVAMDSTSPATAVQIGDPITQKKLSDAIVKEARAMYLYNSITDNGAGGISCSIAEMAKESNGAEVDLEKVPLKYPGLRPWEIWISESQERMTLSVPPKKWEVFKKLMESRGVEATVVGQFNDSGRCVVKYEGRKIMDIDLEFLHNGLPAKALQSQKVEHVLPQPQVSKIPRGKILEELIADKNICGFSFISEQYDHEVQAGSVLKPISGRGRINTDAQVFRPVLSSRRGVALSASLYPSYGDLSTYHMAACALDTAIRNIVASGGTLSRLAVLDNFCWCSSYDKGRLYELKEAVKACYDYAVGYGTPLISGKDSMFNDFKGYDEKGNPVAISIPPTLLISALSVIPDIYKTVSPEFKCAGDLIYLLGETYDELGASEYYKLLARKAGNNSIGGNVPKVNLEKNKKVYQIVEELIQKNLLASSVSVASGGLAVALSKSAIGGMFGCRISLENVSLEASLPLGSEASKYADIKLFSESQGRILVSVARKDVKKFEKIAQKIPCNQIGEVTKDGKFIISDEKNKKVIADNVKKMHDLYHNFSNKMQ